MAHNPGMYCPHCGHRAAARSSRTLSSLLKEIYYQCKNPACGFCWVSTLEAARALSPSGIPNPGVNLPLLRYPRDDLRQADNEDQISIFDDLLPQADGTE